MGQRDHQRVIADGAAVIAEVRRTFAAGLGEAGSNRRLATLGITLQRQRHAQVDQRQATDRLAALVVVQRAQGAQRRAVDAGQHVAGIRLVGELQLLAVILAVELVATGQQVLAEAVECLLQHVVRHGEATVLGIEQELGDVRGQPRVHVAIVTPHREVAVGHLHRRQTTERAFHALAAGLGIQAVGAEHRRRRLVQDQRGVALAGGLFGTAVGVVQRTLQRTGERDRRQRADQQARIDRLGHQAIGQAAIQADRGQRIQRAHLRTDHLRPRRTHRQVVAAVGLEAVAIHPHPHLGHAVALARRQREAQRGLGIDVQLYAAAALAQAQRAFGVHLHVELAGLAGEVLHVQGDGAAVTRGEHARHAGLGQDRRAHDGFHIPLAVLVIAVDQRRHAQGAVEVRHLQADARIALGIELHRAGEQVHGLHARGRTLGLRQCLQGHVAAELQLAAAAVEAFDHPAVDVVGIDAEATLGEEVRAGIGHREAGDVEDAHVHRRDGDVRGLAGQLRCADRHRQVLFRTHLLGRDQTHGHGAALAVHRHVHHAHGAGRGDLAGRAAATEHQRGDVDVVALPVGGDRDLVGGTRLGVDLLHVQHAVALDHQDALAGVRRGHRHLQGVAGLVAGLVQAQLDLVRACIEAAVVIAPAPAGAERIAAGQAGGRIEHVHPVLAPLHREIEGDRAAAGIDGAGFLVLEAAGEIVVPAVVVEGPVVVAQFAHQGHLQALGRLRLAGGIDAHQLEARVAVGIGTVLGVEQRAHADQRIGRPHDALEGAGDRAATGFVQAARQHHGDRRLGLGRLFRQRHVFAQLAIVRQRGVDHVLCFTRQLQGRVTEEITRQAFHRLLFGGHGQARGEAVAIGRGAIQIGTIGLQAQLLARLQRLLRAVQVQLHALGQEFLDTQGHALDRFLAGRVGAEFHLPAPGRRLGGNGLLEVDVALVAGLQTGLAEGLAVGLLQAQEHRLGLHRLAVVVAQQGRQAHGFTGAVQVATGPGVDVEPGIVTTGHGEFAQVQRRLVERQEAGVLAAAGHQHLGRVQGVVQQRVAVAVGAALEHHLALGVKHAQVDVLQRRTVLQRGGMDEQLVLVGTGMQADVADREERGIELAFVVTGALEQGEVQARLLQLLDVLGRQVGQHPLVLLATQDEAVDVDRLGQLVDRAALVVAAQFPAATAAAALVLAEEGRQVLLAHAQEFDVDLRHVHRHHRQAAAVLGRQHAALRGETGHRLQLAAEHLLLQFLAQAAAVGGQQVFGDDQAVFLAGFNEGIAQGQAVVGQGPAAVVGADLLFEAHQRVEVLGADQRARELQRQRQPLTLLVRVRAQQGEVLHLLGLGGDGFAAGLGQLPAVIATTGQAQQEASCQHSRRPTPPLLPCRTAHVVTP